ncbi:MAG: Y-family DNA polymerase [Bacteroidetes bacterium]|nr:Y-family DNA polymerase [Bacteroidota bacterium]
MIALVDCNNFYVSCERTLDPSLNGRPVIVLSNNDGVVISRSNEAKALGIPMAAPVYQYKEIIAKHRVVSFSANFNLYMQLSERVMAIVNDYSPEVEVYSVDEAFIDMTGLEWKQPEQYLASLRKRILDEVGIPVSIGIAETKTLTKVASEIVKKRQLPEGVLNICGEEHRTGYLQTLPVGDLWGVGRRFGAFLADQGIRTALELMNQPDAWVLKHLHIGGLKMVWELRGIPCFGVEANLTPPKQIMRSRSFGNYVTSIDELKEAAALFTSMAAESLRAHKLIAGVGGVFLHTNLFNDDEKYSNSVNDALVEPTAYTPDLIAHMHRLLESIYRPGYRYRKLGVILTDLFPAEKMQLTFSFDEGSLKKHEALMGTLDKLNSKYRENHLVMLAAEGIEHAWRSKQEHLSTDSPAYVDPKERTRFLTTVSAPSPNKMRPKREQYALDPAQDARALGKQIAERMMAKR